MKKTFGVWSRSPVIYSAFGEGLLGWAEIIFERWKANPLFKIALCTWEGGWTKVEGHPDVSLCLMHKIMVFQTFSNQAYTNLSFLDPAALLLCLDGSCLLLVPLTGPEVLFRLQEINPTEFVLGFYPRHTLMSTYFQVQSSKAHLSSWRSMIQNIRNSDLLWEACDAYCFIWKDQPAWKLKQRENRHKGMDTKRKQGKSSVI